MILPVTPRLPNRQEFLSVVISNLAALLVAWGLYTWLALADLSLLF